MKIFTLSGNDCGGFKKPKGHFDSQTFPECEGTETDRDVVKKTRERRKKVHAKVHAKAMFQEHYCSKCGASMGLISAEQWKHLNESCDACNGRKVQTPMPPKAIMGSNLSISKFAQGEPMTDVRKLESPDEEFASQMLSQIVEKALEGNVDEQQFLSNLWDGESWESIKKKVLVEGSTWYVWWMDGVRKFLAQMDTKEMLSEDPDEFAHGIQPDTSASKSNTVKKLAQNSGKYVMFYQIDDPNKIFAVIRDPSAALKMWSENRWDFEVNGIRYKANDFRGREAIEKLFGESILIQPANCKSCLIVESKKKKKKKKVNPFAVCHTTVDKDENPEKYERCVKKIKRKQSFNLNNFVKKAANITHLLYEIQSGWNAYQILQAIKALGEESIAGFSAVSAEDVPEVLAMAEEYELGEIKNWLSQNVGANKTNMIIESNGL